MKRRGFLRVAASGILAASGAGCAPLMQTRSNPKVVVVGGGYGGATAAKYLRMWSSGAIDVTLVEPNPAFVSCPLSNLVLGGSRELADLTLPYDALTWRHGVRLVQGRAAAIEADKRFVLLEDGQRLAYDRLVVSPGIDFLPDALPGLARPGAQEKALHAWKAGPQTVALRRQLEAMPDGGSFVMSIPRAPYRCPPGPYERACQVAHYFSRAKPNARVVLLDANEDVTSKGTLFKKIWAERYGRIIDYRASFVTADVDAGAGAVISEFGEKVQGSVLNVIPPHRAGTLALQAGLANINKRWCEVNFRTMESTQAPYIHVLGDAIAIAPLMPKSAHMANQHAKVCAAAIVDLFGGREPDANPMMTNTCYSFVSDRDVIHVASVHRYDAARQTMIAVPGSGGVSEAASELEGRYAVSWASNIWADTLL